MPIVTFSGGTPTLTRGSGDEGLVVVEVDESNYVAQLYKGTIYADRIRWSNGVPPTRRSGSRNGGRATFEVYEDGFVRVVCFGVTHFLYLENVTSLDFSIYHLKTEIACNRAARQLGRSRSFKEEWGTLLGGKWTSRRPKVEPLSRFDRILRVEDEDVIAEVPKPIATVDQALYVFDQEKKVEEEMAKKASKSLFSDVDLNDILSGL